MPKSNTQELNKLGLTKTEKKYLRQFIRELNLGEITSVSETSVKFGINVTFHFDDNGNNSINVRSENFRHSQSLDGVFLYTPRDTEIRVYLHCDEFDSYEHLVLFIRSVNNQLTKEEVVYNQNQVQNED